MTNSQQVSAPVSTTVRLATLKRRMQALTVVFAFTAALSIVVSVVGGSLIFPNALMVGAAVALVLTVQKRENLIEEASMVRVRA